MYISVLPTNGLCNAEESSEIVNKSFSCHYLIDS